MEKITKFIKIFLISIILFLFFDLLIGKYIYKKFIKKKIPDVETSYVLKDEFFDHKYLTSYRALVGYGDIRYTLCTDKNGFRTYCENQFDENKSFDIAFIGDSFTEGIGLEYEKTFVGIISKKLKKKKIANLATASYSPSIYFSKLNYLINNGYKFGEIIVFMDLSDLSDDILCYSLVDKKIQRRATYEGCYENFYDRNNKIIKFFPRYFKLTNQFFKTFNEKLIYFGFKKQIV